jgi:tRNA-splicing ligase RtcB
MSKLRIVTPVDPNAPDIKRRLDILQKYRRALAEEAPSAYKPVGPIIQTVQDAGIADPVVKLKPLLTVKG